MNPILFFMAGNWLGMADWSILYDEMGVRYDSKNITFVLTVQDSYLNVWLPKFLSQFWWIFQWILGDSFVKKLLFFLHGIQNWCHGNKRCMPSRLMALENHYEKCTKLLESVIFISKVVLYIFESQWKLFQSGIYFWYMYNLFSSIPPRLKHDFLKNVSHPISTCQPSW